MAFLRHATKLVEEPQKMWLLLSLKMRELTSKMAPKARHPKLKGKCGWRGLHEGRSMA